MTKTLDDIWAEIHYSEDSIPSIRAGCLTDDTKQEILQWVADNIIGDYSGGDLILRYEQDRQRKKLKELGWKEVR